jgi:hypothetical protein
MKKDFWVTFYLFLAGIFGTAAYNTTIPTVMSSDMEPVILAADPDPIEIMQTPIVEVITEQKATLKTLKFVRPNRTMKPQVKAYCFEPYKYDSHLIIPEGVNARFERNE